MIAFSFGNASFNNEYTEQIIEMVIDAKSKHQSVEAFAHAAFDYINTSVYPGEDYIDVSYEGFSVVEKQYKDIIIDYLQQMNQKVEIHFGDIGKTYKVKKKMYNPYNIEYILETKNEYVLVMWATTA